MVKIVSETNPESLKKSGWTKYVIVHVEDMSVCIMLMVCASYPMVLNCVPWNMPPALKNFLSIQLFYRFLYHAIENN